MVQEKGHSAIYIPRVEEARVTVRKRKRFHMSQPVRILLHGVTGRMGRKRHLEGALMVLRDMGADLQLTLAGRNFPLLEKIGKETGAKIETDLSSTLTTGEFDLFFDASNPLVRPDFVLKAIDHSIPVYVEKPVALNSTISEQLFKTSQSKGVFTGIVQDKLFTPGYLATQRAIEENLLGEIFNISGEFGYWVETGFDGLLMNRPSWNYQRSKGGSLIADLFSHWNYIIEMVDRIDTVTSLSKTNVRTRRDEEGKEFIVDVPDLTHVLFQTERGITGNISSSWVQRPVTPFTTRIMGSQATLITTPESCILYSSQSSRDLIQEFAIEKRDEFLLQWREVLSALKYNNQVSFNFAAALRQSYFCDAIELSSLSGSKTTVKKEGV